MSSSVDNFSFDTRLAYFIMVLFAIISSLAVIGLLIYFAYGATVVRRGAKRRWAPSTPIHYFFLSLIIGDLAQSVGRVMDLKWMIDARVEEGPYCTVQAIFRNIGDLAIGLSTLAISIYTLGTLARGWNYPPRYAIPVVAIIWLFLALNVGVGLAAHKGQDYYGDAQYWCWITRPFLWERLFLDYFWLWLSAAIEIVAYVPQALLLSQIIVIEGFRIRWTSLKERATLRSKIQPRSLEIARQFFWYPLVYIILILPMSAVRWVSINNPNIPFGAVAFASIIMGFSGVADVILYRRMLNRPHAEVEHDSARGDGKMVPDLVGMQGWTPPVIEDE